MKTSRKLTVKNTITLKSYNIVYEAVERGVSIGYSRAHKHTETPDENTLLTHINEAIMTELDTIMDFGE